jgi:hypothetical protein
LNRDLFRTDQAKWAVLRYLDKHPAKVKFAPVFHDCYVIIGEPHDLSENWNDFFVESMLSNWKASVCQCRYDRCSRYFLLDRPRQCYRYGTFCCPKHQSQVSAAACTLLQRVRSQNELIEFAAKQLLDWNVGGPDWREADPCKRRLSGKLCQCISRKRLHNYRQEVGVNWVNRHSADIELKRAQLWAHKTGTTGATGADEQSARRPLTTRLKWVLKPTPDLRNFIRVLSIE